MRSPNPRLLVLPLLVLGISCNDATATQALADFLIGYCSTPLPAFVAVKNENGSWTQVTLDANGKATVKVGQKFGVATVYANTNGSYNTTVSYLARSEGATAGPVCDVTGTKTVNGTVAGMTSTNDAQIQLGNRSAFLSGTSTSSFQITQVRSGAQDLVAQRRSSSTGIADKIIVRRAQDIATGTSMTLLDFAGSEAVAPASGAVTITGLGASESKTTYALLRTATTGNQYFFFNSPLATTTSGTVYGVPSAQVLPTDMHVISVYGSSSTTTTDAAHGVDIFKRNIAATNADVGPAISTPTLTVTNATAKVLRLQLASQSEYSKIAELYYAQGTGSTFRSMAVWVTAGYLGSTPATWDIQPPDLSAVTGFPTASLLGSGPIVSWFVYAQGDLADWFKQTIDVPDGTVSKWAYTEQFAGTTGLLRAPQSMVAGAASAAAVRERRGAGFRMSPQ